jgi:hypothetical protein
VALCVPRPDRPYLTNSVLMFKTNQIVADFLLVLSYNFRPKRCLHCPYLYSATISDPPALLSVLQLPVHVADPPAPSQYTVTIWYPHAPLTVTLVPGTISDSPALCSIFTATQVLFENQPISGMYQLLFQTHPLFEQSLLVPKLLFQTHSFFALYILVLRLYFRPSSCFSHSVLVCMTYIKSAHYFQFKLRLPPYPNCLNRAVYRVDFCRKQLQ